MQKTNSVETSKNKKRESFSWKKKKQQKKFKDTFQNFMGLVLRSVLAAANLQGSHLHNAIVSLIFSVNQKALDPSHTLQANPSCTKGM